MAIGNRSLGGRHAVDILRDQVMMLVRRLRVETADGVKSWTQLALLAAIDRLGDNVSPTDLANDMDVRSSNIAAGLREAEGLGYLRRAPDLHDKRKALVQLTPQGRDALEAARTQRSEWLSSAVASLNEEDRRTLFLAGDLFERLATDKIETTGLS